MQNYSITYTGIIISILGFVLTKAGIAYGANDLAQVVSTGIIIIGWITAFYGRYRHGNITVCGFKF